MAGFDVLLNHVFNHSPLLNRRRPQASQIGEVTLYSATRIQASRTFWSVTALAQVASKGWPLPEKAMPESNGLTQLSGDHAAGSPFNAWLRPDGPANVVAPILRITPVPLPCATSALPCRSGLRQ